MTHTRNEQDADPSGVIEKSIRLLMRLTVTGQQSATANFEALASEAVRQLLTGTGARGDGRIRVHIEQIAEDTDPSQQEENLPHA